MITKKQYVEYLVSTPKNCTCTYLAEHLEDVSHDVVNDFLHQKRFLPREVWKLMKDRIQDSKEAFCWWMIVSRINGIPTSWSWCERNTVGMSIA